MTSLSAEKENVHVETNAPSYVYTIPMQNQMPPSYSQPQAGYQNGYAVQQMPYMVPYGMFSKSPQHIVIGFFSSIYFLFS